MTVVTDVHGILSVLRLGAQLNSSHSKRGGGGGGVLPHFPHKLISAYISTFTVYALSK